MSASSVAQRKMFAIAEHAPEKLYAKNRDVLGMPKSEMHKFAHTPERNLPRRARNRAKMRSKMH